MSSRIRAFLLSLTIVAVLAFSVVGTTTAYADGEKPPEPVATEPAVEPVQPETVTVDTIVTDPTKTAPTEETGVPVEEAATPVPTEEVVPVESEATPAPVLEAEPPAEETAPKVEEPILDAVPENTTVTVLNAEGESQPLATQESADAIASTTDPIWCPAGQAPTPGANGCTPSFTSFTALLEHLNGNGTYAGAGTIYVQAGAVQGGATVVDFNNYDLSNIDDADLTITGGWNTSTGAVDPNTPSTFSNTSFIIGSSTNPWGGSLSINNINISGGSSTGITAYSVMNINLSNVDVNGAANGLELDAGRDVNIRDSNINRNNTIGATIRAGGNVAIANSSFSNPNANDRRQDVGLYIVNGGSVSLFSVVATGNRRVGAHIESGGRVSIGGTADAYSVFSGTKELTPNGEFLGYGLQVNTTDAIDLNYVDASDNFLWGAMLTAGGDVTIANSRFNLNTTEDPGFIDDTGLLVTSGGNVSILNSEANDNRLIGATVTATGDVSISNSQFNSNNGVTLDAAGTPTFHGYGLQVVTQGSIFLDGVNASDNTLFGAHLDAGADVQITNSNFSNNTTGSATDVLGRGLEVISAGNVSMTNVVLDNNQTFGANIQTTTGFVFLDNVTATNNGTNGVEVEVAGCSSVFLINGTYTGNGQYGLNIVNGVFTQSGGVFGSNGAGDILHTTTCPAPTSPTTTPTTPVTPGVNSLAGVTKASLMGASGVFKSSVGILSASGRPVVTLNSFLASSKLAGGHVGLFFGKYAFVYFSDGSMQIIMLSPNSLDGLAMN